MTSPAPSRRRIVWGVLLCACFIAVVSLFKLIESHAMHKMPSNLTPFNIADPAPACARWRDQMPKTRGREAYRTYIAARKLWRDKGEWELSRDALLGILTDVKQAAKKGDWGAKALLAHFYLEGLGGTRANNVLPMNKEKAVEIEREAAAHGQAWGFYDLGVAHEYGYGGVAQDKEIAWAYYLKAAKLGSPEAQLTLAEAYQQAGRLEQRKLMLECAYAQGNGVAAYELGFLAGMEKRPKDALRHYQDGIKFGSKDCAGVLLIVFHEKYWTEYREELLEPLGLVADPARSKRYRDITKALEINPDLRFGQLDAVLPLPPAQLPEWRGIEAALTPEPEGAPTY